MSCELVARLTAGLEAIPLIDPHSHINPHAAPAKNLAEILGYHYYTELAHSAGLARAQIEEPGLSPKEKVARLVPQLRHLENTVQYSWLLEICRVFFDFHEPAITPANWERLYDNAQRTLSQPDWETQVLRKSGLEAVFLTNDFDDPLVGFDTQRYIPCLRTDDLVFKLSLPETRTRLEKSTGVALRDIGTLVQAIGKLFDHFRAHGCRACAISLPPWFTPAAVSPVEVAPLWSRTLAGQALSTEETGTLSRFVFWTLAQFCAEHRLPFDLMIGVNRQVYPAGVFQGQDLFDIRWSMIQYRELLNAFPQVTFPISVLASNQNEELMAYSWIFPNVVTNGHWWYSNIPAYIALDCRSRLQAVPRNKQIGYYSDMYKLEFGLPKFAMYRRVLAQVLAEDFVQFRGWSEDNVLALGRQVLRGNVETIFGG